MPNEVEVTSSNLPSPSYVDMVKKRKKKKKKKKRDKGKFAKLVPMIDLPCGHGKSIIGSKLLFWFILEISEFICVRLT
jgi:hypothetical protein